MTNKPTTEFSNDFPDDQEEAEDDLKSLGPQAFSSAKTNDVDWTIETILSQLRKGNLNLSPSFQRRDVWSNARKSQFIESLFLGLPVPQIVLAEDKQRKGRFIVLDGKQRLLSIAQFGDISLPGWQDQPPLRLSDLSVKKGLNGLTLDQMRRDLTLLDDVNAFENETLRCTALHGWHSEEVLYLIFFRLNSGSLPLSPQELRHVLHPGGFVEFAFSFTDSNPEIAELISGKRAPDFRMRDVEILIRHLAFRNFFEKYTGSVKHFLDYAASALNENWKQSSSQIRDQAEEFLKAIAATKTIFGDDAFRKWTGTREEGHFENRFNRAILDVMAHYLADDFVREQALSAPQAIRNAFVQLCSEEPRFRAAIETTTKSSTAVKARFALFGAALGVCLNIPISIPTKSYSAL